MVRGRRRVKVGSLCKTKSKHEHPEEEKSLDSFSEKGLKSEFQGRLSHSSPLSPMAKITRFFPVQVPSSPVYESNISPTRTAPIIIGRTSPRKHASTTRVVLQQANSVLNGTEEGKDVRSPHKIEMLAPVSPSYALAKLSLQSPKKPLKCKRRLNTNQTINQPSILNIPLAPTTVEENHKLTDYFPVRRSVRKTKRTVLEERQRVLEDAVLAKREEGLEVLMFEGKGRGIVATRSFLRGEFVVEYAGELITMEEAKDREQLYAQDQNTGCYMYYFKHRNMQYCVDATPESDRLGRLVNHSRNGNLLTKTVVIGNRPHLVLIAKDNIQQGEEVTYDYGDRSKESLLHHPWLAT